MKLKTQDGDTEHQLKDLKFTAPSRDLVLNRFIPQVRFPLLTDTTTFDKGNFGANDDSHVFDPHIPFPTLDTFAVSLIIEAKAKTLPHIGAVTSDIDNAGQGYVVRYEGGDIYYSVETGAHEVHGEIRAKYNAFGAANGVLGLPITDEKGPLVDNGRFNHFQGGSIYWTPHTGPMVVRGPIRNLWAAQGWERSSFAYPIADYLTKAGNPPEYWSGFQNGAIYAKGNVAEEAQIVEVAPEVLANLVRKLFDEKLKAADSKMGIEGGVNILNVSDWGYGFWESTPRTITYEINGFYSHGYPVPDPTFRLELKFQFELVWRKSAATEPKMTDCSPLHAKLHALEEKIKEVDKFLSEPGPDGKPVLNPEWRRQDKRIVETNILMLACENSNTTSGLTLSPVDKTLVIYLRKWTISTAGPLNDQLFDELVRQVPSKFPFAVKTIPAKALLIDVLVTPQGGLKFVLAPEPFGKIRRDAFETELNAFIES